MCKNGYLIKMEPAVFFNHSKIIGKISNFKRKINIRRRV